MREDPRFLDSLGLVALPTAIPVVRMFIADTLRRWHALFIEDHMEAVAVELVSLSIEATRPAEGTSWTDITELNPITVPDFEQELRKRRFEPWRVALRTQDRVDYTPELQKYSFIDLACAELHLSAYNRKR